jgi:DNA polymerase III delta prime subunit
MSDDVDVEYQVRLVPKGQQNIDISEDSIVRLMTLFNENNVVDEDDEVEIVKWLNGDSEDNNYCRESKHYEGYESPIMRYCIVKVLERDFEICDSKWFQANGMRVITKPALFESKEVQRGMEQTIPRRVVYFLKRKSDESMWAIRIFTWDDADSEVVIHTTQSHGEVQDLWAAFKTYFVENGPLKGECFTPDWKWVDLNNHTWDDVTLSQEIKEDIDVNIVDFINNIETFKQYDLPTNRGILFAGQPGTGKTLTLDVLLSQFPNVTRIYATADTLYGRNHVKKMYDIARRLSPTIIAIEDIDTIGSSDDEYERSPLVGEILTALNGAENNSGVITIATTNYPDSLDVALRDRPGRFDSRIDFEVPDKSSRIKILTQYISKFTDIKTINVKKMAKETDGFTGAWLRELVMLAFSLSLRDENTFDNETLDKALDKIKVLRKKTNKRRTEDEQNEALFG